VFRTSSCSHGCVVIPLPPQNRLSWRRSVLVIIEEISPERRDDHSRRKQKKCRSPSQAVHFPGIGLGTWWISTSRLYQWTVLGSHNLTRGKRVVRTSSRLHGCVLKGIPFFQNHHPVTIMTNTGHACTKSVPGPVQCTVIFRLPRRRIVYQFV